MVGPETMETRMAQSAQGRSSSEAGFTIVEGLVAALILAVVLIGILPMITRSMQNNLQGNDATNEANAVTDTVESLYSLPYKNPEVTVAAGSTSLVTTDYFLLSTNTWSPTTTANDDQYTRTVTVEYFGGADLRDDGVLNTPLDGGSLPGAVQLKRLTLDVTKRRVLGANPYRVVALKAY
jgi:competence protein ComGC